MGSTQAELSRLVQAGADQVVGALRRAVEEGLDVAALTDLLAVALTQRNRIDAAVTGAIGALDRATERAGLEPTLALSAATWLNHTLRVGASAAHAQVRLARRLPGLPETAAAFERGELSGQHAGVIARAVEQVTRGGGEAGEAERLLLQEAQRREPRDLLRWGLGLLHQVAPREMEAEEERRHRRRWVHLSEVFDGGYRLEGYLDPEGGAILKTALNSVLGPRRKGDERTPGERRADGLVELGRRCLDSGELPARGGQRPHLTITATLETLRADPGAPAALLDWGFPISGRALRRIAMDAEITPILLSEKGDPLHVGRRYRTATPKMRRALAERDRRCVWPGCDRPPEQTQADHEPPWAQGGRTEVEWLRLLCTAHHGRLGRGWRLERLPDGHLVVHPPPRSGPVFGPAVHQPPPLPGLPGP
jgi:hypothetical protein